MVQDYSGAAFAGAIAFGIAAFVFLLAFALTRRGGAALIAGVAAVGFGVAAIVAFVWAESVGAGDARALAPAHLRAIALAALSCASALAARLGGGD